uniref:Putative methyltransferase n=1 Tax=viral metagenome TaxID=1070528 RepID=A0A6M3MH20_9ZZZZ
MAKEKRARKPAGLPMRIEMVRLSELERWPRNPKLHAEEQIGKSIDRFGFVAPILVDERSGRIVAGHGRLDALLVRKAAGDRPPDRVEERDGDWLVPVVRGLEFASDQEAEAYLLADNQLTMAAGWDEEALAEILNDWDVDVSLDGLGFDQELLDSLGVRAPAEPEESQGDSDAIPEVPAEPVSRAGDLWVCGDHRVLCGDSTEADQVGRLVDGQPVSLLLTDPPYGVSYADKNKFLNAIDEGNRIQDEIEGDHQTVEEMAVLWLAAFRQAFDVCAPGAAYYVCSPQRGELMLMMMMSIRDAKFLLKHAIIWAKNNHVLGRSDYHYKHEPILYGWKPGAGHKFYGGTGETSLWEIDRPSQSKLHPTMKPVALFERPVKNSSQTGERVYDPFLGSGTTMIACETLGRRCLGMEIDPRYVDVVVRRWEEFTGQKAVLEGMGKTFDEVTKQRQKGRRRT